MTRRLFTLACLLSLLLPVSCVAPHARAEKLVTRKSWNAAGSPGQLVARIDTLLSHASAAELDGRVAAEDCTISLAAGWERVRRTVRKAKGDSAAGPEPK